MRNFNNIIIGSGASGSLLSILLKEKGFETAVIEGSDRILKKLLVTGNGRCNLTNIKLKNEDNFKKYFTTSYHGALTPLYNYKYELIEDKFKDLGIPMVELEDGKMYPMSLQASSVVDALRLKMEELNIPIFIKERANSIKKSKGGYFITTTTEKFTCNNLIIATGGMAMPSTGSDGSINKILKELGFNIIKQEPALVQLKTDFRSLKALSGVKIESSLKLLKEGKCIESWDGELLFTDYGISGPPVLQLSRYAATYSYKNLSVVIDLFKDYTYEELKTLIVNQIKKYPNRQVIDVLNGIIHKKLIPVLFKLSGVDKMTNLASTLDDNIIDNLLWYLKEWEMNVTGHNDFKNAQSTVGGVDLNEINLNTLESTKNPNIYFMGEVLDVCGASGGYNLAWAFSNAFCVCDAITK